MVFVDLIAKSPDLGDKAAEERRWRQKILIPVLVELTKMARATHSSSVEQFNLEPADAANGTIAQSLVNLPQPRTEALNVAKPVSESL